MCPVAPHAGAWIEMPMYGATSWTIAVAPHAGAWIEILLDLPDAGRAGSLPMRERGLKCDWSPFDQSEIESLPMRERGLK